MLGSRKQTNLGSRLFHGSGAFWSIALGRRFPSLWLRLANRPGYSLGLSDEAKQFVWECVLRLQEVTLYQLDQPRGDLVLHDRYRHMDGDLGIVLEPEVLPQSHR